MCTLSTLSTTDFLTACLVVLTGLSVVLTGVYAWLTHQIMVANRSAVEVMRQQVEASTRPYIDFDLVLDGATIEAVLRNVGSSAAMDLKVSTEPPLMSGSVNDKRPCRIVASTIAHFSPGREIREFVGGSAETGTTPHSKSFAVTIDYRDSSGKKFQEKFTADLLAFEGMLYLGRPDLPKEVQKIAQSLSKINDSLSVEKSV